MEKRVRNDINKDRNAYVTHNDVKDCTNIAIIDSRQLPVTRVNIVCRNKEMRI